MRAIPFYMDQLIPLFFYLLKYYVYHFYVKPLSIITLSTTEIDVAHCEVQLLYTHHLLMLKIRF